MKKILVCFLCITMVLTLSSCKPKEKTMFLNATMGMSYDEIYEMESANAESIEEKDGEIVVTKPVYSFPTTTNYIFDDNKLYLIDAGFELGQNPDDYINAYNTIVENITSEYESSALQKTTNEDYIVYSSHWDINGYEIILLMSEFKIPDDWEISPETIEAMEMEPYLLSLHFQEQFDREETTE